MKIESWGRTDVGLKRETNQDSILIDNKIGLFIVADGMGGHRGGEVASALAIESAHEVFEDHDESTVERKPEELIRLAYKEASRRIYAKSTKDNPELMGMGTTMVMAFAKDSTLYFGNVGDSRAYLFKDGYLWQLTEDHSLVNEQVKAGVISSEEQNFVAGRNVITRSVGFEEDVIADIIKKEVQPGEIYILCSDGLSGLISNTKLAEICKAQDPRTIVDRAIDAAKAAGGDDNVSVLALKVIS